MIVENTENIEPPDVSHSGSAPVLHRPPNCWPLALLLLVVPPPAFAQSVRIQDVRIGFPAGSQDLFKAGYWTPVAVELEVHGDPFQGRLVVETADGDGALSQFKLEPLFIDTKQDTRLTVLAYIKIGSGMETIRVHAQGTQGRRDVQASFSYEPYTRRTAGMAPESKLILTLGRPRGFDHVKPTESPAPRDWEVASLSDLRLLPDHWFGYDAVDALILPTGDTAFLRALAREERKWRALMQWVEMGGHLIVSVSSNHNLVGNPQSFPLEPLLPAQVGTGPNTLIEIDRLGNVEAKVRSSLPGDIAAFVSRSAAGQERRPPIEVAQLKIRQSSYLIWASEQTGQGPVVVQAPYGLGRVTLIAFDTDQGPFTAWDSRAEFWAALLGVPLNPSNTNLTGRPMTFQDRGERDIAARFCEQMEQFGEVPVVQFGWVALFIFIYIMIVGPLDYFFLKKVVKRMEWTWITFPSVVLLVSLGAYFLANHLKGNQLRINKIDLVDIDLHSHEAMGSTWFTIFSPRLQHYDVGLEPVPLGGGPAEGVNLSWLGRPEGGMRGLRRGQSPGLFTRTYEYDRNAQGLKGVPIQVWSVKTFTGRWLSPIDPKKPPVTAELVRIPQSIQGSITSNLPWPLKDCRLIYRSRGWSLGALEPGQKVTIKSDDFAERRQFFGGGVHGPGVQHLFEMMFHKAIHKEAQATSVSEYLDHLDQSWRLDDYSREAVLIGVLGEAKGQAADINAAAAGCRLTPFEPPLAGVMSQQTIIRIFIPLPNVQGDDR